MPAITRFSPKAAFATLALVEMNPNPGAARFAGVYEDGEGFEIEDAAIGRQLRPVQADEHGAGVYARIDGEPFRYEIDYRAGTVSIENGEELPLDEFVGRAARVDDNGRFICLMRDSLYHQIVAVKERGRGADAHAMDIPQYAEHVKAREVAEGVQNRFTGLYDIVASGLDDRHDPMATMRDVNGIGQASMRNMHPAFAAGWAEVRAYDQFKDERVRALFRQQLGDRIGQFPLGSVLRLEVQGRGGDPDRALRSLCESLERSGAVQQREDRPFDLSNYIPGYRTSVVPVFDLDGIEVIAFADRFGTYAYAYPPSLDYRANFNQARVAADEAPTDKPAAEDDAWNPYAPRI